jgi:hypothetical protein
VLQAAATPVLQAAAMPVLQAAATPVLQAAATPVLQAAATPETTTPEMPMLQAVATAETETAMLHDADIEKISVISNSLMQAVESLSALMTMKTTRTKQPEIIPLEIERRNVIDDIQLKLTQV